MNDVAQPEKVATAASEQVKMNDALRMAIAPEWTGSDKTE
jgi:hypothetical protein